MKYPCLFVKFCVKYIRAVSYILHKSFSQVMRPQFVEEGE